MKNAFGFFFLIDKMVTNFFRISRVVIAAVLGGFCFLSQAFAQEASFIIDLNSKTWIQLEQPGVADMNDAGQVVGSFTTPEGEIHPFITGPDGKGMRDLGTLGGNKSYALGINNVGQVVGWDSGGTQAFITGPDGMRMRGLGSLGGSSGSYAQDVNDSGQVVGWSVKPVPDNPDAITIEAFITGPNGVGMREVITNVPEAVGNAINEAGQVAGGSSAYTTYWTNAFVTGPNGIGLTDLGNLQEENLGYGTATDLL